MSDPNDPRPPQYTEDEQERMMWEQVVGRFLKFLIDDLAEWDPNSSNEQLAKQIENNLKSMKEHGLHCPEAYEEALENLRSLIGRATVAKPVTVEQYYARFPILNPVVTPPEGKES